MRQMLSKVLLRIPFFGRLYLKATLRYLEKTPPSKMPPQLRQLKTALDKVPKHKRLAMLEDAVSGKIPPPDKLPSRQLRRAAARQAKRR
jgi:hypothetical protein